MKAVILVGGLGTRLRPLTCSTPKPMIPLMNQPFIVGVIERLRDQGVSEVILAVQYLADQFRTLLGDGARLGVRVQVVEEPEPRGTAGAVRHVAHLLTGTTFVLNGDVMTDLDLRAMLAYHHEQRSKLTISLAPVADPSAYGVVEVNNQGRIGRFVEKPRREDAPGNLVNTGTYILEPELLRYAPAGQYWMFERGLFPQALANGEALFGYQSDAYWTDIGTPPMYLAAHRDILTGRVQFQPPGQQIASQTWVGQSVQIDPTAQIDGPVVLGDGVQVGPRARITGPAVIGMGCSIGAAALIEDAVLWAENRIDAGAVLRGCVLGVRNQIGTHTYITDGAVIGDDCTIGANNRLERGIRIWPGTVIQDQGVTF